MTFRHSTRSSFVVGGMAALTVSLVACTNTGGVMSPTGVSPAGGDTTSAKAEKVEICHRTDVGAFDLLKVSGNALAAHLAHGDSAPGGAVPGSTTDVFDANCVAAAAPLLACPCWNDYSSAGLAAALNAEEPSEPICSVQVLGAAALDNDGVPMMSAQNLPDSSGKRCTLRLTGVPLRSQLFLGAEVAAGCVAEAAVIVPQVTWCPAGGVPD